MEGRSVGHNFERDPPKDHLWQVWFNLVQRFQRRRFKCESLRRTPSDGKSSHGLWPGELKKVLLFWCWSLLAPFYLFSKFSVLRDHCHTSQKSSPIKGSLFYLCLTLVQINFTLSDNIQSNLNKEVTFEKKKKFFLRRDKKNVTFKYRWPYGQLWLYIYMYMNCIYILLCLFPQ